MAKAKSSTEPQAKRKRGGQPGGKKRTYSDTEKAQALAMMAANGGNLTLTATEMDIPISTIQQWWNGKHVHQAVIEIKREQRGMLANMLRGFVSRVICNTTDEEIQNTPLKDRFVALGIAADKSQLLDGDATSITGQTLTEDEYTRRLRELADRVRSRQIEQGGGSGVPLLESQPASETALDSISRPTNGSISQPSP